MYTVTLTAVGAEARGRQKQSTAVVQPEAPWETSAYGRPTSEHLQQFVAEWEKRSRRTQSPLRVTRAVIVRRRGHPKGIVAVYSAA
jgi:hypothetical protein